jgi:hypothetical protein
MTLVDLSSINAVVHTCVYKGQQRGLLLYYKHNSGAFWTVCCVCCIPLLLFYYYTILCYYAICNSGAFVAAL